jgi:hypothetical protein
MDGGDVVGTNFEWRDVPCGHCGRSDPEIHVGKRSAGWSFGFQGYPHQLVDEAHPDWGFGPQSPFGFPVMSRADWRTVFTTTRPGTLVDEYGQTVDDPVAWLDALPAPDADQIARERAWMVLPTWYVDDDWRDPEGFRFTAREFS